MSTSKGNKDSSGNKVVYSSVSNFDILFGDDDVAEDDPDETFTHSNAELVRHRVLPKHLQPCLDAKGLKEFPKQFIFRKTKVARSRTSSGIVLGPLGCARHHN